MDFSGLGKNGVNGVKTMDHHPTQRHQGKAGAGEGLENCGKESGERERRKAEERSGKIDPGEEARLTQLNP